MLMANHDPNLEIAVSRIADIAMVTPRHVHKALRGELVRGAEGQRVAVALRALGVQCVVHPNLALDLKKRRVLGSEPPTTGQMMSITRLPRSR